jgi:hypothetical protein
MSFICDKTVTTQNLSFFVYCCRKKLLQMHFYMYSVIMQFAKLAAGEQLCRRCTHRILQHFKTFKVSPEKSQIFTNDTFVAIERYIFFSTKTCIQHETIV